VDTPSWQRSGPGFDGALDSPRQGPGCSGLGTFLAALRRRSCPIPKLGNWNHLIRKRDNFFIPTPMRFIQLPGDSQTLYVSKSSFLQSDSSWFDWNDGEVVLFPNWETGIT